MVLFASPRIEKGVFEGTGGTVVWRRGECRENRSRNLRSLSKFHPADLKAITRTTFRNCWVDEPVFDPLVTLAILEGLRPLKGAVWHPRCLFQAQFEVR